MKDNKLPTEPRPDRVYVAKMSIHANTDKLVFVLMKLRFIT
jgi:hypothetical protein